MDQKERVEFRRAALMSPDTQIVRVRPDRMIVATGPDQESYRIVRCADDRLVCQFETAGVNGKTADETAEANLADWTDTNGGECLLFRDELLVAYAEAGVIYSLRPDNPAFVKGVAA